MPPKRGKYKRYLLDSSVKMPPSTFYKKRKLLQNNESVAATVDNDIDNDNDIIQTIQNEQANLEIYHDNLNFTNSASNIILQDDDSNNYSSDHIENTDFNSIDSDNDLDHDDFIDIFGQTQLTKEDLSAAYLTAFFSGKITQTALKDFISISNIASEIKLPTSFDGLTKVLMGKNNIYKYTKSWFCGVCLKTFNKMEDRYQRSCSQCCVKLNMSYYIDIEEQIRKIFKDMDFSETTYTTDETATLRDITDGRIYKKLLSSEDGKFFKKREAFSFLLNTDGISICQKSKLTIWPFYLTINELPIQKRFSFENLILAG